MSQIAPSLTVTPEYSPRISESEDMLFEDTGSGTEQTAAGSE